MKKALKPLIIAGIVTVVLGGGLITVMNLPSDENPSENISSKSSTVLLYDKSTLAVEQITVKNSGGEYTLLGFDYSVFDKDENSSSEEESSEDSVPAWQTQLGEKSSSEESGDSDEEKTVLYTMQGTPDIELSKNLTDDLAHQCGILTATSLVDKSGKKFSEYGLDNPRAEVSVIFGDGSSEGFFLGNDAPDNQGVYLRRKGSNNVYLVASASVNMFFVEKLQMYEKTVTSSFDSDNTIKLVNVSGSGYSSSIEISEGANNANFSKYVMYSPYREICDDSTVETIGEGVYGITPSTVEAVIDSDEVLEKYGLKDPYMDIIASDDEGNSAEVLVSSADENNICYVMQKDGKIILSVKKSEISAFYGVQYKDFLKSTVISPNMSCLDKAEILYNGKTSVYEVSHTSSNNPDYEEIISSAAILDGNDIKYSNLNTFIGNISGAQREENAPESIEGDELLFSLTLYFCGGEGYIDKLEIYRTPDNKRVIVLNGIIECFTDNEYIDKVLAQTEYVPTSIDIEIYNEDFEQQENSDTGR